MGVFCQGDEENKKLATENRTGKRPPPRRGLHRLCGTLLTCGAQRGWGAHPHAWRREGPLSQDPVLTEEAGEAGPERPGRPDAGVETQQGGRAANSRHRLPPPETTQHGLSVDGPILGGRSHSGHQEGGESQPHACSTTAAKGHIYI